MSIFLTEDERVLIEEWRHHAPLNRFYWALLRRAHQRAESPGLINPTTSVHWWHSAAEYVTDGAMAYALQPNDMLGRWLRDVTLSLARRSEDDWVGPAFRDHTLTPQVGNLETAHLCLSLAVALDLAPDVFLAADRAEITDKLRNEGMPLCLRWLEQRTTLNNWFCILTFGLASAAAVLDEEPMMQRAADFFNLSAQAFQPDGSYTESLQYANYAAQGLMLAYEALVRRDATFRDVISPASYARSVRWSVYSFFYAKPITRWGAYPLPRSANFNDSAAIHRPTADVLLHIAARAQNALPQEAGLARWLFDTLYLPYPNQGPFDLMSFGFFNNFGFLTMPLLPQAAEAMSPTEAALPPVAHFSNGDTLARPAWDSRTILATHGGGGPYYGPGHLHGDLNSFILVHNEERLLADPGHGCYRNLIRELDISTQTHNTCTFEVDTGGGARRMEEAFLGRRLQQMADTKRYLRNGEPEPPPDRGGQHLLDAQHGPLIVIGSEAAELYGPPLESFNRFWFLLDEHALFVVDHIVAAQPVRTTWHWLLNNRDDTLDLKLVRPDRLVARRGNAGLKIFHVGEGMMQGPIYAHLHDAYHPLPDQNGEGHPGSGMLVRWQERESRAARIVVHAIPVDSYGAIAGWHLRANDDRVGLEGPGGRPLWTLAITAAPLAFTVRGAHNQSEFHVAQNHAGEWTLTV